MDTPNAVDVYPETSEPAFWDISASVDITGAAEASVFLDDGWHELSWLDDGDEDAGTWTRRGSLRFRGSEAETGTEVTRDDYVPPVRITIGDQVLIRPSSARFILHT